MNKFLSGAACGAIVGSALTFVLIKTDDVTEITEPMRTAAIRNQKESVSSEAERAPVGLRESLQRPPSRSVDPGANPFTRTSEQAPRSNMGALTIQSTTQTPAPTATASTSRSYGSTTAADPILMTDAHREMLTSAKSEDGNMLQQEHLALEQESRDQSWSYYMEQMLSSYIGAHAPQGSIELTNIVCRSTACEIQAFDGDGTGPGALGSLLAGATKETWWEFNNMQTHSSDYQNRTRTIVYLGRTKKGSSTARKLSS